MISVAMSVMLKFLLRLILALLLGRYVENAKTKVKHENQDPVSSYQRDYQYILKDDFKSIVKTSLAYANKNETCAEDSRKAYVCPGGVCCTPDSQYSKCCSKHKPFCVDDGCCAPDRQISCGEFCCHSSEVCVNGQCTPPAIGPQPPQPTALPPQPLVTAPPPPQTTTAAPPGPTPPPPEPEPPSPPASPPSPPSPPPEPSQPPPSPPPPPSPTSPPSEEQPDGNQTAPATPSVPTTTPEPNTPDAPEGPEDPNADYPSDIPPKKVKKGRHGAKTSHRHTSHKKKKVNKKLHSRS